MINSNMSVYEFGGQLLETNDLDPVYILIWRAMESKHLPTSLLYRYLLAYWCFYHVGTAAWIVDQPSYWAAMDTAARSKEYHRSSERRHFRGKNATNSVAYLKWRGYASLFSDLIAAGRSVQDKMAVVQRWVGFGPWIAFKVADMLERLDICPVDFDNGSAFLFDSPRKAARLLADEEGYTTESPSSASSVEEWAVDRILSSEEVWSRASPPRYDRKPNVQEAETILCKWGAYRTKHYLVGKDIEECRHALEKYGGCLMANRLVAAGKGGRLW